MVALVLGAGGLHGQAGAGMASMEGRIVPAGTTAGITGAEVALVGPGRQVTTDSTGRYVFRAIPLGTQRFLVRALGFRPVELTITLVEGDEVHQDFELETAPAGAQPLEPIVIDATAAVSYRLTDFERRRKTGRGHYLTDEEIKRSGASRLQDLMRGMRGVTEHCAGTGCRIQMVRAREGCEPDYVIDGHIDNMFGAATPIRDIVGLEVYTGPSDVPGEFAGTTAGCGVVVIWTRAGPPRNRK